MRWRAARASYAGSRLRRREPRAARRRRWSPDRGVERRDWNR